MNLISRIVLLLFLSSFNWQTFGQEKFTISGTITDQSSNETLIGVNIIFPELQTGTTTNEYGFYSITIPQGTYQIQISYLGFTTITETILLTEKKPNKWDELNIVASSNKIKF